MFLENLFCIKETLINLSGRLNVHTHLISVSLKLFCKAAQKTFKVAQENCDVSRAKKLLRQRKKICGVSRETKNCKIIYKMYERLIKIHKSFIIIRK